MVGMPLVGAVSAADWGQEVGTRKKDLASAKSFCVYPEQGSPNGFRGKFVKSNEIL